MWAEHLNQKEPLHRPSRNHLPFQYQRIFPRHSHQPGTVNIYGLATMPGWRDEYLANLQEAERNNPVNRDLVEACTNCYQPR